MFEDYAPHEVLEVSRLSKSVYAVHGVSVNSINHHAGEVHIVTVEDGVATFTESASGWYVALGEGGGVVYTPGQNALAVSADGVFSDTGVYTSEFNWLLTAHGGDGTWVSISHIPGMCSTSEKTEVWPSGGAPFDLTGPLACDSMSPIRLDGNTAWVIAANTDWVEDLYWWNSTTQHQLPLGGDIPWDYSLISRRRHTWDLRGINLANGSVESHQIWELVEDDQYNHARHPDLWGFEVVDRRLLINTSEGAWVQPVDGAKTLTSDYAEPTQRAAIQFAGDWYREHSAANFSPGRRSYARGVPVNAGEHWGFLNWNLELETDGEAWVPRTNYTPHGERGYARFNWWTPPILT